MLQALLHKKLKDSFGGQRFKPSEDSLTSSVIGLLQYLPSELLLSLLRKACGLSSSFPLDSGAVEDVMFWERWDARDTTNVRVVEPDVLIVTEQYFIIVEVKKSDEAGQYVGQWKNEVRACRNSFPDNRRKVILLALGGNTSLKEHVLNVGEDTVTIYPASWFNLLYAISKEIENPHPVHIKRLLAGIIDAFEIHRYFNIEWLSSLKGCNFIGDAVSVFTDAGTFSSFYYPEKPINSHSDIWQI